MLTLKKSAISLILITSLINQTSYATTALKLPDLGSAAASTLSIEKEQRIGKAYMMALRNQLPIVNDPLLNEYIQDLGHKLVANAGDVKTPFNFFMVENKVINAFAFFGGHVGVHTSLLQLADTESELASVIGHEISHVTQRHLARSIEARAQSNPATLAAVLGSIALAIAGAPQAGMAGLQTSLALSQQMAINYTRSHEKEADRIGIALLARSEFDPRGAPAFFSKMAQKYRFAKRPPPMLLTHPVTEKRIADTRMRASAYPQVNLPPQLNFQLAKARVIARYSGLAPQDIRSMLNTKFNVKNEVTRQANSYGEALLLLKTKKATQALKIIEQLRKDDPNNLYYLDSLTDIYLAMGQPKKAVVLLEHFAEIMPNNSVISLNLANALLAVSRPERAIYLVEQLLVDQPDNISAWSILKQAQSDAKNNVGRYMAMAEISALYGNHRQALKHLYAAHNLIRDDDITKAKLEARVRQLRIARDDLKKLKI